MGLNVVKQVLTRMGATMQMHSEEGKGLSVTLFIPLDYIDYVKGLDFHHSPLSSPHKEKQTYKNTQPSSVN